jgi:hypothetical protein
MDDLCDNGGVGGWARRQKQYDREPSNQRPACFALDRIAAASPVGSHACALPHPPDPPPLSIHSTLRPPQAVATVPASRSRWRSRASPWPPPSRQLRSPPPPAATGSTSRPPAALSLPPPPPPPAAPARRSGSKPPPLPQPVRSTRRLPPRLRQVRLPSFFSPVAPSTARLDFHQNGQLPHLICEGYRSSSRLLAVDLEVKCVVK